MIRKALPQRGFTMIELLVAMAVSLIVMTMIAGIFTSSRINHDVQDDVAQMQENIRTAGALVRRVVYHAGHKTLPQSSNPSSVMLTGAGAAPLGISGGHGVSLNPGEQDNFISSYEGDGMPGAPSGAITDCMGNPHGVGTAADVAASGTSGFPPSVNRLEVRNINGRPWLSCSIDAGATWVPLVPDVEAMEVQYGEDTDADTNVDRYVNANQGVDFTRVINLRVHLLFRTNRQIASSNPSTTYVLDDRTYGPFTDFRVRKAVVITAGVRNARS